MKKKWEEEKKGIEKKEKKARKKNMFWREITSVGDNAVNEETNKNKKERTKISEARDNKEGQRT